MFDLKNWTYDNEYRTLNESSEEDEESVVGDNTAEQDDGPEVAGPIKSGVEECEVSTTDGEKENPEVQMPETTEPK